MAVQLHVSHSSNVNGSAVFAGGPFYCAQSNVEIAQYKCMETTMGVPSVEELVALTHADADLGLVDPPRNMKGKPVYLFSGKDDSVVSQTVMMSLYSYYDAFGAEIAAEFSLNAEHCLPTLDYGEECATLSSPYLGKCNFDGAGKALQHLYDNQLTPPKDEQQNIEENLFAFDQTPFFLNDHLSSLGDVGYIYIPSSCQQSASQLQMTTSCRLHISFHGCKQNLSRVGNEYAAHSGFNSWAEANDIVVLYPYAEVSNSVPFNPKGCWDWWAYTGVDYGTKSGLQVRFVAALAKKLGWEL